MDGQTSRQIDRWADGWTDKWTDESDFIGHSATNVDSGVQYGQIKVVNSMTINEIMVAR